MDAKPGFALSGERTPAYLGGAGHGSLHFNDSISPMIFASTSSLPKHNRAGAFKEWLLKLIE